ncbi:Predicted arabinose efflux permease, MFS family [Actinacidiphila guanduensis]|uniref:Predicted arabinose efflux permease, MFS family n=1 Tax=Actinacidiphila guanduensis TaxID=310781 RepID=A0A1H0N4X5_9ACTN|nr:Predicted arabinose efflux permease, MFS family [Actinacidiphila guanduensis]
MKVGHWQVSSHKPPTLASLVPAVFLPVLIFETGMGALAPVLALSGRALGAGVGTAGLVLALLGVGQILGDVPAGALAARLGDRKAMLVASGVTAVTLTACALARTVWELALAVTVTGASNAVIVLARQSYLTEVVPPGLRARALSTLGGMSRVGAFVGPFLGAAVLAGHPVHDIYWLALLCTAVTVVVLLTVRDVAEPAAAQEREHTPVRSVLRDHRRVFLTLGLAVLLVGSVRATRQTVLPLWAEHLGQSPSSTSVVFGIAGLVDTLTFYPSGQVMDRAGRLWIAVPSMLVLGATQAALPLTHGLVSLTVVAMLMGFGNGIGSGILMTLGADVAPPRTRSQFLGVWRLCADSGSAGGPLVVSAAASLGSLAAGIFAMGAVGIAAAGALLRWVPRYSPYATKGTRHRSLRVAGADPAAQPPPTTPPPAPPPAGPAPAPSDPTDAA